MLQKLIRVNPAHQLLLLFGLPGFLFTNSTASAQTNSESNKPTLYYIPHTHWEGAVFKTREEYLDMGLPNILKALSLLKRYPDYKFTLDQVAYFKPFLERYPEEAPDFRRFIAEGRLSIVGGMDVMPDDVKPGGELFIRQMQYGKRYCREQLGVDVTVAWLLDTFGHHPQLPQLLKLAGYKSFWFCRGVPTRNMPSEFFWRGIDGTEIPAFWLPGFYGLFYGPPRDQGGFSKFFQQRFNSLNSHARGLERVGLTGVDVSEPEDYVPPLVEQFNQRGDAPFRIRYSGPAEFAAVVARRTDTPVINADLSPIFQGTYSSRIELKQVTREIEQQLLTAEKLSAVVCWLGAENNEQMLWRAWEPVLFNQTHDLASGVMTDHVYEEVVRGYDFSRKLAEEIIDEQWERITAHIDTSGAGIPVVVFNTLSWPRTDQAEVELGFADQDVRSVTLLDTSGKTLPVQLLETERYAQGGIKRARLAFMACEVPALGYATYHVLPSPSASPTDSEATLSKPNNLIDNEYYRATFNRTTGELTSLWDKSSQWEALAGSANVIARQQDKGDLWELYRGLDGGSYIAMTNRQAIPKSGEALLSSESAGTNGTILRGPVFSEFSVSHPFGSGSFTTRARLYSGVKRLEIRTELVNNEKYVRYQALFPTAIREGRQVQEIPLGAVERPTGIEFPAQNWIDYSDASHGVTLVNAGLPGNLVTDSTIMLSLLRSHNLGAYGYGGGYEPGMSSETGFELGQRRTFRYAVIPHAGDWRAAGSVRAGLEFNSPLLVRKIRSHHGSLTGQWGLLEISTSNVVASALTPGPRNTTLLRVYETAGESTPRIKLKLHARIQNAYEVNLMNEPGQRLNSQRNTVTLDLHPFEIKTLQLQLQPGKLD